MTVVHVLGGLFAATIVLTRSARSLKVRTSTHTASVSVSLSPVCSRSDPSAVRIAQSVLRRFLCAAAVVLSGHNRLKR